MTLFRRFIFRLVSFVRANRAEDDLAKEINSHLALLEEQFRAQGMTPDDARCAARRAFGGVEQAKEHQRDTRSFRWLDDSWLDLKLGVRMLGKYPGLTFVGGLGMTVAIGISVVAFSVFYTLMDPSLPLDEGDRVVGIENWDTSRNNQERRILHDFAAWRREVTSIRDIGAFRSMARNVVVDGGAAEEVAVAEMTASGFRVARVPPHIGRPLVESDEQAGAPAVAVIGAELWRARFAADPSVIGRTVRIGEAAHTVVGVMPEGFQFPLNHSVWTPLSANPSDYARRRGPEIYVFGRLAPDATLETAQAELSAIGLATAAALPASHERLRPRVVAYASQFFDDMSRWEIHLMQAFISLLVVVVSINVTILVYARTVTRHGEIAVRTALGASRRRIVAQLFLEALVLSLGSAALGVTLAAFVLEPLHGMLAMETGGRPPFWVNYHVSLSAAGYAVALAVLAALIVGVLPALKATGRRVQSQLRYLGGGTGLQLGRTWTTLIVVQVAISVAILPAAIYMSWQSLRQVAYDPGFAAENFVSAQLVMDRDVPPTAAAAAYVRAFNARLADRQMELAKRLMAEPSVAHVTFAAGTPGRENQVFYEVEGIPPPATARAAHDIGLGRVDMNFFDAFGASILDGRGFRQSDFVASPTAVVVNRTFVERVLGGGNAIGRHLRDAGIVDDLDEESRAGVAGPWFEIVGVVEDLPARTIDPAEDRPRMYRPIAPGELHPVMLIVRTRGGATGETAARVREITTALDPTLHLREIATIAERYRWAQMETDLAAAALSVVAMSVLLLSAGGIYALMAFTVARRRREIGIRVALGANPRRILGSIFARASGQLAMGLALGIGAALFLEVSSNGEHMGGHGLVVLPVVAALMLTVGLCAAAGPARRGLKVPPTQALRE